VRSFSNAMATVRLRHNLLMMLAKLRDRLALIKAKEHITVKEAALLLSCSQSHIRKLVMLARKGKARRPVPYVDMEGVTIFPRESLLDWARPTSHLQVVKHEAA